MEVSNPRRVLAVSLESQADTLSKVLKDLTGSTPQPASTSLAGTTHDLPLKTQYYTATVPVWIDLVASPDEWAASFLSDEAGEVLAVLGGLVVVFALADAASDEARSFIQHVGEVVNKGLGGWEWDGVRLAVGVGDGESDEWDELCAEAGLEFVQVGGQARVNEFGEKTGIARVKEALEANDWQGDAAVASDFGDFETTEGEEDESLDPESLEFGYDKTDFDGLKQAIWAGSTDVATSSAVGGHESAVEGLDGEGVDKVEKMMRRLQAVREAGEGMPDKERKRMAARAVQGVMKEL